MKTLHLVYVVWFVTTAPLSQNHLLIWFSDNGAVVIPTNALRTAVSIRGLISVPLTHNTSVPQAIDLSLCSQPECASRMWCGKTNGTVRHSERSLLAAVTLTSFYEVSSSWSRANRYSATEQLHGQTPLLQGSDSRQHRRGMYGRLSDKIRAQGHDDYLWTLFTIWRAEISNPAADMEFRIFPVRPVDTSKLLVSMQIFMSSSLWVDRLDRWGV